MMFLKAEEIDATLRRYRENGIVWQSDDNGIFIERLVAQAKLVADDDEELDQTRRERDVLAVLVKDTLWPAIESLAEHASKSGVWLVGETLKKLRSQVDAALAQPAPAGDAEAKGE